MKWNGKGIHAPCRWKTVTTASRINLHRRSPGINELIWFGQNIATSHDLTPNGGFVREFPLFQENLGWWNIIPFGQIWSSDERWQRALVRTKQWWVDFHVSCEYSQYGWWFRNPANQLRLVVYPIIYDGFQHHPRWLGMGFLNHQQYCSWNHWKFGHEPRPNIVEALAHSPVGPVDLDWPEALTKSLNMLFIWVLNQK